MKSSTKGSILLLDDDKFLLEMYTMKFTQAGFEVHPASSRDAALQILREGIEPDAILFDLIMPEGDGFSFFEMMRKENIAPKALKIALTNENSEEEKKRIMDLGASDYLVKATMIPSEVVEWVGGMISHK